MKQLILGCGATLVMTVLGALSGCGSGESDAPIAQDAAIVVPVAEKRAVRPPVELDDEHPVVAIKTSAGVVTVQLDALMAPVTVGSFLSSVANGNYNGTIFHQVEGNYIAIAGEYDKALHKRSPSPTIRNEANNGLSNKRLTISMTRDPAVIDSSTGPFFFNLVDNPHLDHESPENAQTFGYCVFGKLTEGEDVLEEISDAAVGPQGQLAKVPVKAIVIESMTRIR